MSSGKADDQLLLILKNGDFEVTDDVSCSLSVWLLSNFHQNLLNDAQVKQFSNFINSLFVERDGFDQLQLSFRHGCSWQQLSCFLLKGVQHGFIDSNHIPHVMSVLKLSIHLHMSSVPMDGIGEATLPDLQQLGDICLDPLMNFEDYSSDSSDAPTAVTNIETCFELLPLLITASRELKEMNENGSTIMGIDCDENTDILETLFMFTWPEPLVPGLCAVLIEIYDLLSEENISLLKRNIIKAAVDISTTISTDYVLKLFTISVRLLTISADSSWVTVIRAVFKRLFDLKMQTPHDYSVVVQELSSFFTEHEYTVPLFPLICALEDTAVEFIKGTQSNPIHAELEIGESDLYLLLLLINHLNRHEAVCNVGQNQIILLPSVVRGTNAKGCTTGDGHDNDECVCDSMKSLQCARTVSTMLTALASSSGVSETLADTHTTTLTPLEKVTMSMCTSLTTVLTDATADGAICDTLASTLFTLAAYPSVALPVLHLVLESVCSSPTTPVVVESTVTTLVVVLLITLIQHTSNRSSVIEAILHGLVICLQSECASDTTDQHKQQQPSESHSIRAQCLSNTYKMLSATFLKLGDTFPRILQTEVSLLKEYFNPLVTAIQASVYERTDLLQCLLQVCSGVTELFDYILTALRGIILSEVDDDGDKMYAIHCLVHLLFNNSHSSISDGDGCDDDDGGMSISGDTYNTGDTTNETNTDDSNDDARHSQSRILDCISAVLDTFPAVFKRELYLAIIESLPVNRDNNNSVTQATLVDLHTVLCKHLSQRFTLSTQNGRQVDFAPLIVSRPISDKTNKSDDTARTCAGEQFTPTSLIQIKRETDNMPVDFLISDDVGLLLQCVFKLECVIDSGRATANMKNCMCDISKVLLQPPSMPSHLQHQNIYAGTFRTSENRGNITEMDNNDRNHLSVVPFLFAILRYIQHGIPDLETYFLSSEHDRKHCSTELGRNEKRDKLLEFELLGQNIALLAVAYNVMHGLLRCLIMTIEEEEKQQHTSNEQNLSCYSLAIPVLQSILQTIVLISPTLKDTYSDPHTEVTITSHKEMIDFFSANLTGIEHLNEAQRLDLFPPKLCLREGIILRMLQVNVKLIIAPDVSNAEHNSSGVKIKNRKDSTITQEFAKSYPLSLRWAALTHTLHELSELQARNETVGVSKNMNNDNNNSMFVALCNAFEQICSVSHESEFQSIAQNTYTSLLKVIKQAERSGSDKTTRNSGNYSSNSSKAHRHIASAYLPSSSSGVLSPVVSNGGSCSFSSLFPLVNEHHIGYSDTARTTYLIDNPIDAKSQSMITIQSQHTLPFIHSFICTLHHKTFRESIQMFDIPLSLCTERDVAGTMLGLINDVRRSVLACLASYVQMRSAATESNKGESLKSVQRTQLLERCERFVTELQQRVLTPNMSVSVFKAHVILLELMHAALSSSATSDNGNRDNCEIQTSLSAIGLRLLQTLKPFRMVHPSQSMVVNSLMDLGLRFSGPQEGTSRACALVHSITHRLYFVDKTIKDEPIKTENRSIYALSDSDSDDYDDDHFMRLVAAESLSDNGSDDNGDDSGNSHTVNISDDDNEEDNGTLKVNSTVAAEVLANVLAYLLKATKNLIRFTDDRDIGSTCDVSASLLTTIVSAVSSAFEADPNHQSKHNSIQPSHNVKRTKHHHSRQDIETADEAQTDFPFADSLPSNRTNDLLTVVKVILNTCVSECKKLSQATNDLQQAVEDAEILFSVDSRNESKTYEDSMVVDLTDVWGGEDNAAVNKLPKTEPQPRDAPCIKHEHEKETYCIECPVLIALFQSAQPPPPPRGNKTIPSTIQPESSLLIMRRWLRHKVLRERLKQSTETKSSKTNNNIKLQVLKLISELDKRLIHFSTTVDNISQHRTPPQYKDIHQQLTAIDKEARRFVNLLHSDCEYLDDWAENKQTSHGTTEENQSEDRRKHGKRRRNSSGAPPRLKSSPTKRSAHNSRRTNDFSVQLSPVGSKHEFLHSDRNISRRYKEEEDEGEDGLSDFSDSIDDMIAGDEVPEVFDSDEYFTD